MSVTMIKIPGKTKRLVVVGVTIFFACIGGYGLIDWIWLGGEAGPIDGESDVQEKLALIIMPFLLLHLALMHLGRWQDKGTPKLSLLSLMYFGVGVGLMLLGLSLADLQAFLIFLPLGLISLVLGYWCYLNEEDINVEKEKKTSLGLDFERVIQLFKEIKAGNYSNLYGTKYNKDVSDAALQAASEEQIAGIANLINLGSKLELEVENPKRVNEVIMDKLRDAYIELEKDSKYTLIPLFLNEEAKETSPYFLS